MGIIGRRLEIRRPSLQHPSPASGDQIVIDHSIHLRVAKITNLVTILALAGHSSLWQCCAGERLAGTETRRGGLFETGPSAG